MSLKWQENQHKCMVAPQVIEIERCLSDRNGGCGVNLTSALSYSVILTVRCNMAGIMGSLPFQAYRKTDLFCNVEPL